MSCNKCCGSDSDHTSRGEIHCCTFSCVQGVAFGRGVCIEFVGSYTKAELGYLLSFAPALDVSRTFVYCIIPNVKGLYRYTMTTFGWAAFQQLIKG